MWDHNLQQKTYKEEAELRQNKLILQPDNYQIDGDLLKLNASWVEGKQPVQAYYRIKNQAEQKDLAKITTAKVITVTGNIRMIQPPTNENQFDYRRFIRSKRVVNTVQISKMEIKEASSYLGIGAKGIAAVHSLRKQMLNYFASLPAPLAGYSQILLLGYYAQDFTLELEQINKLGLLHLFSLSGMHIFYLLAGIRFILGRLRITRETCDNLILLVLPFYAILGGLSSSLIRAVMMSWLMISTNKLWHNGLNGIEAESIVLLLHLFYSPGIIFSLGTQLSYLLTLILMMSRKMNSFKLGLKMNGYSLPLILWHTFRWNLLTTIISILIIPVFEWLIIPAVIIGSIVPWLQFLCNEILSIITKGLGVLANLPTNIIFGKPPLFFVLFWLGLMLALEVTTNRRKVYLLGLISYCLAGVIIRFPLHDEVVFMDIGQGDCTLIRKKFNREVTLVDTGGKVTFQNQPWQKRHSRENGETVVANYLLSKGVAHIDWLFLTHQDTDHVGNFPVVSRLIKVKKILVPAGMEKLPSFRERLLLSANKLQDVIPIATATIQQVTDFRILHPFEEGKGTNEDSITITTEVDGVSLIISGDLDKSGELEVIQRNPGLHVDILKTGHHGSKTSTDDRYVEQLQPQLAIISAGRRNHYGHPNQETLVTLEKRKIAYLNTAEVGMIKLIPNGPHQFRLETGNTLQVR